MPLLAPMALILTLQAPSQDPLSALQDSVSDAIEAARPSVVAVTRIGGHPGDETKAVRGRTTVREMAPRMEIMPGDPFGNVDPRPDRPGFPPPNERYAPEYFALPGDYGSGVVLGDGGEILTAFHVVQGADRIRVRAPGVQFDAVVIAADPRTDLAVIVPSEGTGPPPGLEPMKLGDASKLRVGQFLIALGNPYNAARDGTASASFGILANEARRVEPPIDAPATIKQYFRYQTTLIQLDSKLNLGMSGGAVVDLDGRLVGITTSAASPGGFDAEAGYAIPMDALGLRAVRTLLEGREVEYGFIGIGLDPAPNTVSRVLEGTPAAGAGLLPRDVITAVGPNVLADDESALPLALAGVAVGEPVELTIRRGNEIKKLTLVMSKYPVVGEVIATVRPDAWRGLLVDFSSVLADGLQPEETLGAMQKGGVGVVDVRPGSPAFDAGVTPGAIVSNVDGKPVATPAEFRRLVSDAGDRPVTLTLVKGLGKPPTEVTIPSESAEDD